MRKTMVIILLVSIVVGASGQKQPTIAAKDYEIESNLRRYHRMLMVGLVLDGIGGAAVVMGSMFMNQSGTDFPSAIRAVAGSDRSVDARGAVGGVLVGAGSPIAVSGLIMTAVGAINTIRYRRKARWRFGIEADLAGVRVVGEF